MPNRKAVDYIGYPFDRLTIEDVRFNPRGPTEAFVRCVCGRVKWVLLDNVVRHKTTSCGCYQKSKKEIHPKVKRPQSVRPEGVSIEEWNHMKKIRERLKSRHRYRLKLAAMSEGELRKHRLKRQESKRIHRAKKYGSGGRHSEAEWQALLAVCHHKCVKCTSGDNLSRDHIIPLSRGGSDEIFNIQPLCRSCNSSKRTQAIDYRTGEMITGLEMRLPMRNCRKCNVQFRLTNRKKVFCTRQCGIKYHNDKKKSVTGEYENWPKP